MSEETIKLQTENPALNSGVTGISEDEELIMERLSLGAGGKQQGNLENIFDNYYAGNSTPIGNGEYAILNSQVLEPATLAQQEINSALSSSSKQEFISFGIDNLVPELHDLIAGLSLPAKVCRIFLSSTFNTSPIFGNATAKQASEAMKLLESIGVNNVLLERLFSDNILHGGISPLVIFGVDASDKTVPKRVLHNHFKNIRLGKPLPVVSIPGYKSIQFACHKDTWLKGTTKQNPITKYPIVGSTIDGYGRNNYQKANEKAFDFNAIKEIAPDTVTTIGTGNAFTGIYYGMKPHEVLKYYPLPIYHTTQALSDMWGSAELAQVKANMIKKGLFLHSIIVINRKKLEGRDTNTGESKELQRRKVELEKFSMRSGSTGGGSSIVVWNDRLTKDSVPPIELKEVPSITQSDFLTQLNVGQLSNIRMAYMIPNPTFVGIDQTMASGWSNQAAKAYVDFVIMAGSVGRFIQQPITNFLNWLLEAMGQPPEVRITKWEDPLLMEKLEANSGLNEKQKSEIKGAYLDQELDNARNATQKEKALPA